MIYHNFFYRLYETLRLFVELLAEDIAALFKKPAAKQPDTTQQ